MKKSHEERNYVEITKEELQRMRGNTQSDRHHAKLLLEKEKLKALSEERAERWPNTIKALRTKRLLARKEQLEKFEERDAQLLYKVGVQENWKRQEQKWLDFQKQQEVNWKEEEEKEMREKKELLITLRDARLEQLQERQSQLLKEKEKMQLEKEKLRQQAEQDQIDTELKKQLKKKRAHEANIEIIEANKVQQAQKEQEKEKLISMDRKIAEYAAKWERIVQEKKEEHNAKAAHKGALHEALIARQEQVLLAARVDSEAGLQVQEKERDIAEDAREKMRAEKSCKDWEACNYSRKQQIYLRKKELEEEREEEKCEALKSWQRCWQVKADDEAEEKSIASKNRQFADHHLKIVERKGEQQLLELEESKGEYLQAFQRMKEEDVVALEALTI